MKVVHTEEDEISSSQDQEYDIWPKYLLPSNGGYIPYKKSPSLHKGYNSTKKSNLLNPISAKELNNAKNQTPEF